MEDAARHRVCGKIRMTGGASVHSGDAPCTLPNPMLELLILYLNEDSNTASALPAACVAFTHTHTHV